MKNQILSAAYSAVASLAAEMDGYAATVEAAKAQESAFLHKIEGLKNNQKELELKINAIAAQAAEANERLGIVQALVQNTMAEAETRANGLVAEGHGKKAELVREGEKAAKEILAKANAAAADVEAKTAAAKAELQKIHAATREAQGRLNQIMQAAENLAR